MGIVLTYRLPERVSGAPRGGPEPHFENHRTAVSEVWSVSFTKQIPTSPDSKMHPPPRRHITGFVKSKCFSQLHLVCASLCMPASVEDLLVHGILEPGASPYNPRSGKPLDATFPPEGDSGTTSPHSFQGPELEPNGTPAGVRALGWGEP